MNIGLRKILFFSDYFRSEHFKFFYGKFTNLLKIVLNFNKELKIHSFKINDSLLDKNGIIELKWKIENLLYITINDNIKVTNQNGISIYANKIGSTLKIEVVGLKERKSLVFPIKTVANSNPLHKVVPTLSKTQNKPKVYVKDLSTTEKWAKMRSIFKNLSYKTTAPNIVVPNKKTEIKNIELSISEFKLSKYNDQIIL